MSDEGSVDFGIWREPDRDLTAEEAKQEALTASQGAVAELREEDDGVEWVRTDVLEDPDGDTDCAYCHYRAPSGGPSENTPSEPASPWLNSPAWTTNWIAKSSTRRHQCQNSRRSASTTSNSSK